MSNKGAAAICLQHPCLTILCHIRHMTNPIINYICNYPAIGIISGIRLHKMRRTYWIVMFIFYMTGRGILIASFPKL